MILENLISKNILLRYLYGVCRLLNIHVGYLIFYETFQYSGLLQQIVVYVISGFKKQQTNGRKLNILNFATEK